MFGTDRLFLQKFIQFFNIFSCLINSLFGEGIVLVEGKLSVDILQQIHDSHGLFCFVGSFLVMIGQFRFWFIDILSKRFGWSLWQGSSRFGAWSLSKIHRRIINKIIIVQIHSIRFDFCSEDHTFALVLLLWCQVYCWLPTQ